MNGLPPAHVSSIFRPSVGPSTVTVSPPESAADMYFFGACHFCWVGPERFRGDDGDGVRADDAAVAGLRGRELESAVGADLPRGGACSQPVLHLNEPLLEGLAVDSTTCPETGTTFGPESQPVASGMPRRRTPRRGRGDGVMSVRRVS